ncbi:hypothetical protein LAV_00151 [Sphingobium phage Lacusarx]|uniref:Uncharacterized protein n=1 Tax=Sphingobium phage Lacusarx TaxID=1980139 RepID=A0A1W6DXD9_9CAUD|nr:hypothetical protein FDH44_gp152 [Sphingobium phage Lacusarx]ARK07526.1 hypothetical protein LAV_00151 [Sphingobium phage Lacusarx]
MMQLRTVNKALGAKYPGLELVKGEGYYYFAGAGTEVCKETGVYGAYRLNDLTLDQWLSEADDRMKEVAESVKRQRDRPVLTIKLKKT